MANTDNDLRAVDAAVAGSDDCPHCHGTGKVQPPATPLLHKYKPHRKFPWFCAECGYAPHEPLMHIQPNVPDQATASAKR